MIARKICGEVGSTSRATKRRQAGMIILGTHDGKNVKLDLDALLRTRMLVQANSGKGKSWLLRRLAEQLYSRTQIIIIDPEGEFASLREKFSFVLVGKGGETPADPRSAALVAHKLLELRASAVCDLYEMKPYARHEWVQRFVEAMIDAPKNLWHPCVVMVDEAHVYCPEKGAGESIAADSIIGLATRGRKRGFCLIAATQRLGKLRKDVAAELLNVLIGGTFIDIDRKRAADALGVYGHDQRQFFDEIKLLPRGQFFGLGPAISDERELIEIGPVETSHPEAGSSKHAAEPPPAPEKIKALLPKLADLPKEAEEKAKTEAELRTEIRSLKAQLRSRPAETREVKVADPKAIAHAVMVATKIYRQMLQDQGKAFRELRENAHRLTMLADRMASKQFQASHDAPLAEQPASPVLQPQMRQQNVRNDIPGEDLVTAKAPLAGDFRSGAETNGHLPEGEQYVLRAIAQYDEGVERDQLSVLTGYRRSTRDTYIQRLRARGLVAERGNKTVATQEGIDALGHAFEPLPTGVELQEHWLRNLPEGEKAIFKILLERNGEPVNRDELDEITGYKRSSRDTYLQRLAARRIVEPVGRGQVKASEVLFQ